MVSKVSTKPRSFTSTNLSSKWTPWTHLDDLDFAHDMALLSHTQGQKQDEKTSMGVDNSASLELKVHRGKNQVHKNTAVSTTPITLEGDGLEDVTSFTYLCSVVDKQGEINADIKVRTGRARAAFLQMKNIWDSPSLTVNIKTRTSNHSKTCPAVWS